jgi:hypothetical protein
MPNATDPGLSSNFSFVGRAIVAGDAAPILKSKNSRSGDFREVGHAKASMLRTQELREIMEVFDQFAKTLQTP